MEVDAHTSALERCACLPHAAQRVEVRPLRRRAELLAEIDETIDTIGIEDHTDLDAVAITRNGGSACGDEGPCAGSAEADSIRVELIYRAEPMLPVPGVGTIEITGEGQFRCEYR
jgi:hypothetical protein